MRIAVLALQGAFIEHEEMLSKLGVASFEIRKKNDLMRSFDGLIIPGGESTVQGKLLKELDLLESIRQLILEGLPTFGTCAGLLLLSKRIENDARSYLSTMDITAVRNAYGRQLGSFYTEASLGTIDKIPMTFIRAPYIEDFHPELNDDLTVHRYFIKICGGEQLNRIID